MTVDLKPYPAMKDSGVPWLGKVPEHWEVGPNRAVFNEVKERDRPDAQMLSVTITRGVVRQQELLTDRAKKDSSNQDKSAYKLVRPGDIVYNKMRAWQGAIGISNYTGIVSPAYVVQRPRSGCSARYLHHLLRTPAFAKEAERWSFGITSDMWSLRPEHFKMIYGCLPPFPEQVAIARFVDDADRKIRGYIQAKQKLIKLLEEQKQIIIHRVVTRGLDPNVCLTPSGVDWLGNVPAHWEVVRLKAVLSRPLRNGLFKRKDAFGAGVPLVNVADVYRDSYQIDPASLERVQTSPGEARTYQVQPGDLFFVRSSLKLEGTGRSAVALGCDAESVFECHLVQARPHLGRVAPLLLAYQLNSFALRHYLISRANVVTIATIAQDVLASCPVLLPPRSEQDGLLQRIGNACESVVSAIARTRREITVLREYHARLIADVVTGKIDVREAAAGLPNETAAPKPVDDFEATETDEAAEDAYLDTACEEDEA
jgi:type I restriction enzyme S subunit